MTRYRKMFGEFLLIVIGVFVALMPEATMSDRQDDELREEYLQRIADDVTTDRQSFQYRIQFFTAVQEYCQEFLDWLGGDAAMDQETLLAAFYAAEIWPYVSNTSTFQDLQSTGNFRLIDDIDLRAEMFNYYRAADNVRPAWNPPTGYRELIRGIIPSDVQAQIRENCPTADINDLVPTGFPPCTLSGIDYERIGALFEPLRDDDSLVRILTFRHSEIGVMLRLYQQQIVFADNVLARIRK